MSNRFDMHFLILSVCVLTFVETSKMVWTSDSLYIYMHLNMLFVLTLGELYTHSTYKIGIISRISHSNSNSKNKIMKTNQNSIIGLDILSLLYETYCLDLINNSIITILTILLTYEIIND